MISGTKWASQESPVATEQLCMSSHRFGVMNVNGADRSVAEVSGTSLAWHAGRMPV